MPGFDLIHELELYSQAGIPERGGAAGRNDRTGTRDEDGRFAWLAANPVSSPTRSSCTATRSTNVAQLRNVGTTIKGGVMYDTRALYATAGVNAPAL